MRNHIIALAFTILLLTGCEYGPAYSTLQNSVQPKQGMAQIIVYRPVSYEYVLRTLNISFNGMKACRLDNNGFFIKDMEPGEIAINAGMWGAAEPSQLVIKAEAGKKYFIKATPDKDKYLEGITDNSSDGVVFTSPGMDIYKKPDYNTGPFTLRQMDDTAATPELQSLKQNTKCLNGWLNF